MEAAVHGERVGEVVEATSRELVAQSVRLHHAPPFGSLVRVPLPEAEAGGAELYAVVAETRTASLETTGRPIARGHADVLDAAIYRENPDLEHVLRTEFRALLVGFRAPSPSSLRAAPPMLGGNRTRGGGSPFCSPQHCGGHQSTSHRYPRDRMLLSFWQGDPLTMV